MKKNFTLIELLVVIAIIAILVAMLLPALKSARDMAKRIDCAGRMKQMSVASLMYHNDYSYYPPAFYQIRTTSYSTDQYYLLNPYLGNRNNKYDSNVRTNLWLCPGNPTKARNTDSAATWRETLSLMGSWNPVNYEITAYFGMGHIDEMPEAYKPKRIVRNTSRMVMMTVMRDGHPWGYLRTAASYNNNVMFFHSGMMENVLFVDGHTEALKYPLNDRVIANEIIAFE